MGKGKKIIKVKICDGLGPSLNAGNVGGVPPFLPTDVTKSPKWFDALPSYDMLTNERAVMEDDMLDKWVEEDKPSTEPVLVRRE